MVAARLLTPRLASERDPGPGGGRITELADGELEQAADDRVARRRGDVTDVDGLGHP
jgi:hypothetical protein